jgi:hypothetical protein
LAPEACEAWLSDEEDQQQPRTREVDVFAFGVVLFELFTREAPYPKGCLGHKLLHKVINGLRPNVDGWLQRQQEGHGDKGGGSGSSTRFTPKELQVLQQLAGLMKACWAAEPGDRPSFKDIVPQLDAMEEELRVAE